MLDRCTLHPFDPSLRMACAAQLMEVANVCILRRCQELYTPFVTSVAAEAPSNKRPSTTDTPAQSRQRTHATPTARDAAILRAARAAIREAGGEEGDPDVVAGALRAGDAPPRARLGAFLQEAPLAADTVDFALALGALACFADRAGGVLLTLQMVEL